MRAAAFLALCIAGIVLLGHIHAQETPEADAAPEDASSVVPSPNAHTSVLFPDSLDGKFVLGQVVDILLGFHNDGDRAFNVTTMTASINSPTDFNFFIQNFTAYHPNAIVAPGEQATLPFKIRPDPNFEPDREVVLALTVKYTNEAKESFGTVFFNSTILFVEPSSSFNTTQFFSFISLIALAALVGFIGYKVLRHFNVVKGNRGKRRGAPGAAPASVEDFLLSNPNRPNGEWQGRRVVSSGGGKKKR